LSYAFDLAQRGATFSAACEFQSVLGLCALELDARDGGTSHRDALRLGLIALDESDEFSGEQVDWRDSADVRSVAASHATPVLKQCTQSAVDSIQAVQAYYAFAENQLTIACGGVPGASLAFYGLGRTIVVPDTRVAHAAGKAALFHRVALAIAPQNVLAGNELGVLLAQHGHLDEAERMFRQCVAINGTPETYRNLAAIHSRRGDQRASQAALAAGNALAAHDQQTSQLAAPATATRQPQKIENQSDEPEEKASFASKLRLDSLIPVVFRR
jgi:hypothetical protein